jgi:hypothetical protein
VGDEELAWQILEESLVDFVSPAGFGYVKDRRHVAGFALHQFTRIPGPWDRWKVQTVQLVSLLLHDKPVIYASDRLPQMSKVRDDPTRPLDRFENLGLDTLRRGEDLFISRSKEGLRMLGAVRSIRQCVTCHGGNRGDLLGAFSYNIRADWPGAANRRQSRPVDPVEEGLASARAALEPGVSGVDPACDRVRTRIQFSKATIGVNRRLFMLTDSSSIDRVFHARKRSSHSGRGLRAP